MVINIDEDSERAVCTAKTPRMRTKRKDSPRRVMKRNVEGEEERGIEIGATELGG